MRNMERSETELPRDARSSALMEEARRHKPYAEQEEPSRMNDRMDELLPMAA